MVFPRPANIQYTTNCDFPTLASLSTVTPTKILFPSAPCSQYADVLFL